MKLMMKRRKELNDAAVPSAPNLMFSTDVLSLQDERKLLQGFWECKTELVRTLIRHFPQLRSHRPPLEPCPMAQFIREHYSAKTRRVAAIRRLNDRYLMFKHRLALANVRLVYHLAKRFRHFALSYEDLVQEGVSGLMQAVDRFDLSHGTRLATYATWWIRQAVQIAVAGQSHLISLSTHYFGELWAIQQESEALARRRDRLPSAQELTNRTGMNLDLVTHLQTVSRTPVSLDAVINEDTDFQLAEALADDTTSSELLSAERQEALQFLLENLSPREQHVLDLRFGLNGYDAHSLTQIGRMLRISKERVRQIQNVALEKLRASAEDAAWEASMLLD